MHLPLQLHSAGIAYYFLQHLPQDLGIKMNVWLNEWLAMWVYCNTTSESPTYSDCSPLLGTGRLEKVQCDKRPDETWICNAGLYLAGTFSNK